MKIATRVSGTFRCAAAIGFLSLLSAGVANAGCMTGPPSRTGAKPDRPAHFDPAAFHATSATGSFQKTGYVTTEYDEGLVGLWQFELGANPALDWGTQAFHSDGTELMFSGNQDPETGDVCQGVWRQVGWDTYTLNHIAMGWIAPGAKFGVRTHVHEVIKLNASGTAFTGTFSLTEYCENGVTPPAYAPGANCVTPNPFFEFDPSKPVSASNPNNVIVPATTGTLSATRVTAD